MGRKKKIQDYIPEKIKKRKFLQVALDQATYDSFKTKLAKDELRVQDVLFASVLMFLEGGK